MSVQQNIRGRHSVRVHILGLSDATVTPTHLPTHTTTHTVRQNHPHKCERTAQTGDETTYHQQSKGVVRRVTHQAFDIKHPHWGLVHLKKHSWPSKHYPVVGAGLPVEQK